VSCFAQWKKFRLVSGSSFGVGLGSLGINRS
jgi:hypothetical protein